MPNDWYEVSESGWKWTKYFTYYKINKSDFRLLTCLRGKQVKFKTLQYEVLTKLCIYTNYIQPDSNIFKF